MHRDRVMPWLLYEHVPVVVLQVCPVGHVTAVPLSVQVGGTAGVAVGSPQVSVPTSQTFAGVHDAPATQVVQAPARQTPFVAALHAVPSDTATPVSTQPGGVAGTVVESPQLIDPTWHGSSGTHDAPAEQSVHVFPRQTLFVVELHTVPSGSYAVSAQTGAPLPQTMDETVAHGFVEVQAVPEAQSVQTPVEPLQTPVTVPELQAVPAGWNV